MLLGNQGGKQQRCRSNHLVFLKSRRSIRRARFGTGIAEVFMLSAMSVLGSSRAPLTFPMFRRSLDIIK
jgi:hypothetical protein